VPGEDPGDIRQARHREEAANAPQPAVLPLAGKGLKDRKGDKARVDDAPDREDVGPWHKQHRKLGGDIAGSQAVERQDVGKRIDDKGCRQSDDGDKLAKGISLHDFSPPLDSIRY